MPRRPFIILADDLTGAAEIAAIAHENGLRSVVHTRPSVPPTNADVIIFSTETRSVPATKAERIVRSLTVRLSKQPHAGFFKKTDSVLRGPVAAELKACAESLGRRRILLVPCNPSLGRVIHKGRYFVAGVPLNKTIFAHDPHHPCTTSDVLTLLGAKNNPTFVCLAPSARLPKTGVIVGEATTARAITAWAARVDPRTLPAGGADFFRAWLHTFRGLPASDDTPFPMGTALLLSGTTAAAHEPSPTAGRPLRFLGGRPPGSARVTAKLSRHGFAAVAAPKTRARGRWGPATISSGFARLALDLHGANAFKHLLIAGGATASAVLDALGWSRLEVVRVWSPGVVTLRPMADSNFLVTLKPGSYPWPLELNRHLSSPARTP